MIPSFVEMSDLAHPPKPIGSDLGSFPKSIGIVLYPGFEVLDAAGPIEALNCLSVRSGNKGLKLSIISRSIDPIPVGSGPFTGAQQYLPTHTFETAPQLDLLLVPGGVGAIDFLPGTENNNVDDYIEYVRKAYYGGGNLESLKYILSICNGAGILAKAGIPDGRKATTNKDFFKEIAASGPKTQWIGRARWVNDGNVWTTSGVSAGADGTLAFMSSLLPEKLVTECVNMMEWRRAYSPDDDPFADVEGTTDILPQ